MLFTDVIIYTIRSFVSTSPVFNALVCFGYNFLLDRPDEKPSPDKTARYLVKTTCSFVTQLCLDSIANTWTGFYGKKLTVWGRETVWGSDMIYTLDLSFLEDLTCICKKLFVIVWMQYIRHIGTKYQCYDL